MSETTLEPEAIGEIRSGLAGGRYSSCGGYGCYDHTWHMEDVLRAYDQVVAERDATASKLADCELKLDAAVRELEVERQRLAACGVAALGYFDGCADEYRSASLDDVLRLRARLAACERVVKAAIRETSADDAYMEVMENLKDCFQKPDQSLMTHRFAVESALHHARRERLYAVKSYRAAVAAETHTTTEGTDR